MRAGKQPPKDSRPNPQGAGPGVRPTPDLARRIEHHFDAALARFDVGDGSKARHHVEELASWWEWGVGRIDGVTPGLVPALTCSYLCGEIGEVWARGWQPADISRVVGRHLGPKHVRVAVDAIAEEAETYRSRHRTLPTWLDQLDEVGAVLRWDPQTDHLARTAQELNVDLAGFLLVAFEVLVMLHHLPTISILAPPPSAWDRSAALDLAVTWRSQTGSGESRPLERIRALLAKAESTEFDEEAEALTAKAQELMTRHSIDAALLAAHAAGRRAREKPAARRIGVGVPYAQAKAFLLAQIAEAATCRVVWSKSFGFSTVFGFEGELASVELLYTSLLLQARTTMVRSAELGRRAKGRSFRQSFLVGFASRIGLRLKESADVATSDAIREHGGRLLLVLADRSRAVDELRNETFPDSKGLNSPRPTPRAGPLGRWLPNWLTSHADQSLRTRRQPDRGATQIQSSFALRCAALRGVEQVSVCELTVWR